ncbi:hypothetical protein SLA_5164 [Streptomyces laurentii]|uniref:LigA protein n=1 Tax=Streptomyces laurentii TaxID=39478 RepID=A0A160P4Y1_STRLU|nr:hypothetical protein SLA_5164 [Streptomyces laurentii]
MNDDWKSRIEHARDQLIQEADPVAWVSERDAMERFLRYPSLSVRGALFGVAVHREDAWRLVSPLRDATPQASRDSLHSMLWFRAKDDTDVPAERRELLATVAVLEKEPIDEVEVLGEQFRVVRGDELARSGREGLEPPRPTDVEPLVRSWDLGRTRSPSPDLDFALDPGREIRPMAEALRLWLREFTYDRENYPDDVCADSERAVRTHPEVVLMPTTFGVVEKRGAAWEPQGSLMTTPHDARAFLYAMLNELWPMIYEFDEKKRKRYARAAEEFRALGRSDELAFDGRLFHVCRTERMIRFGAEGPEGPRPSDVDDTEPMKMHPTMDEHGVIHYDA